MATEYYQPIGSTPAEAPRDNPCTTGVTEALIQYGLPKATTNPTPAGGTPIVTEVIYDIWGRPVATGYRDGQPTPTAWACTSYDPRGRTTQVVIPGWAGTPARTINTDYSPGGDPLTTTVTDTSTAATNTITTTVDLVGRITTYRQSIPGTTATLTTITTYSPLGQPASATTTSIAGGPTSTLGWTYLPDGRANTTTLDGATVSTVAYDATSKDIASVSYGASGAALGLDQLTKDNAYRPTGQRWSISGRTIVDTLTRSRSGRIVQAATTDSADSGNPVNWSYQYDTAARLTQATLAATTARPATATFGYQYAGVNGCGLDTAAGLNGSRTGTTIQIGAAPAATSQYCTDKASRLTEIKSTSGGTVIAPSAITYDSHGNATQIGNQKFAYDGANRVVSTREASTTPTQSLTYTRDSLGRVTTRHAATTIGADTAGDVLYGYTGGDDSPDYQLSTTGTLIERYLPLPGGVLLTKQLTGPQTATWSLPNSHGDTIATLTGNTVVAGYLYDPNGQPLNPLTALVNTDNTPTTRTGTATTDAWHGTAQRGYEHTGGLNQTLMGARTYLPTLGQFTATDPVVGGNSTAYTYPQDPINGADLTGLANCATAGCQQSFGGARLGGYGAGAAGGAALGLALKQAVSNVWNAFNSVMAVPRASTASKFPGTWQVYEMVDALHADIWGNPRTYKYGITGQLNLFARPTSQLSNCARTMHSICTIVTRYVVKSKFEARLIEANLVRRYVAWHGVAPPGQWTSGR